MTTAGESSPIRNVSDTALWVAIYRAMESERQDALFNDPYARRLGGERGEAIVRAMPRGAAMSWPMVVRTSVMDEIIMRCIDQGAASVLNLAAGLDARPYRLALPKSLRWFHVDMPHMIDYFREQMAGASARCEIEFIAADLRDEELRNDAFSRAADHGPVLVVSEGLLVYLEPGQVADVARALHDVAHATWWVTDIASPRLLKYLARQWGPKLRAGNAPMQFAPAEGTAFFAAFGWREAEFRSSWDESRRLKRTMPGAWLWQLLLSLQSAKRREASQRMSGIVLFERADTPITTDECSP